MHPSVLVSTKQAWGQIHKYLYLAIFKYNLMRTTKCIRFLQFLVDRHLNYNMYIL